MIPGLNEHPERALIRRIIAENLRDHPVDTNLLAQSMHMRVIEACKGAVKTGFELDATFTQGNGYVQGGILSAMLDFGMVFAAFSEIDADHTLASISLSTSFFRAARAGGFVVDASLVRAGRHVIHAQANLFDAEGILVAAATSPVAVIALSPAG